ncbi:phosphatidic acid phosphatase type 2/haloperoxidase, partial [Fimicolochytrium jonesii]|uniref:phosphatidic acid phosphatase type 2/haloperoxidase n=1 Tax=Fimicolochytrium jonesii TaxID=1396493 RepID=UPI0022FE2086
TQTVPSWMLGVLAAIVPLVVILFTSIFVKRSVFDAHMSTLGLAVSLVFTLIFTQIVKIAVGSLRPDFLARCQPVWKYDDMLTVTMVDRCTGDAGDIKEGRKSFFSGHSSMAWSGLGFLAIYLAGRLNLDRKPLAPKYAVVTIPIVVALLISISRVDDYWHRWEDVVVGAVVGATISAWSYSYHCTIAESVVTGDDRSASGIDDTHSSQHRGSTLTQEGSHERLRPGARVSSHRQSTGDVNIAVDDESQTAGGNIRQNNRLEQRNGSFFRS